MQWKYKVIALNDGARASASLLNRLGSDGWELVTVEANQKGRFAYLKLETVKREIIVPM